MAEYSNLIDARPNNRRAILTRAMAEERALASFVRDRFLRFLCTDCMDVWFGLIRDASEVSLTDNLRDARVKLMKKINQDD